MKTINIKSLPVDTQLSDGDKILVVSSETGQAGLLDAVQFRGGAGRGIERMEVLSSTADVLTIRAIMTDGGVETFDITLPQRDLIKNVQTEGGVTHTTVIFEFESGKVQTVKVANGEKGERGEVGPRGERGEVGPQGVIGPQGERGQKGDKGDIGPQGVPGPRGERGEQGVKGDTGERGPQGPQGLRGERGLPGPAGPAGSGTGDMLKANNLSDLTNKVTARNNLQVYSKQEVDSRVANAGIGDMLKSIYDRDNDGKVDVAKTAESVAWNNVSGKPSVYTPASHNHTIAEVTGLQEALSEKANSRDVPRIQKANYNTAGIISGEEYRNSITPNKEVRVIGSDAEYALIKSTSANRMAFLSAEQVIIEQSNDGNVWVPHRATAEEKAKLFNELEEGTNTISLPKTTKWLRITLDAFYPQGDRTERYCQLSKLYMVTRTEGGNVGIKIERSTIGQPDVFTDFVTFEEGRTYNTWPGRIFLNHPVTTFGGGANQRGNFRKMRITLHVKSGNVANIWGIGAINWYGPNVYTSPNLIMDKGVPYKVKNARGDTEFPGKIISLQTPTENNDVVNKEYVDEKVASIPSLPTPKTSIEENKTSNSFFPSIKAVYDWVVGKLGGLISRTGDNVGNGSIKLHDGTTLSEEDSDYYTKISANLIEMGGADYGRKQIEVYEDGFTFSEVDYGGATVFWKLNIDQNGIIHNNGHVTTHTVMSDSFFNIKILNRQEYERIAIKNAGTIYFIVE